MRSRRRRKISEREGRQGLRHSATEAGGGGCPSPSTGGLSLVEHELPLGDFMTWARSQIASQVANARHGLESAWLWSAA